MPREKIVKCSDIEGKKLGWMATVIANLPKSGGMDAKDVPKVKVGIACGRQTPAAAIEQAYGRVLRDTGGAIDSVTIYLGVSAKVDFSAVKNPHNWRTIPFTYGCTLYSGEPGFSQSLLATPMQFAKSVISGPCSIKGDGLFNVPPNYRTDVYPSFH